MNVENQQLTVGNESNPHLSYNVLTIHLRKMKWGQCDCGFCELLAIIYLAFWLSLFHQL